LTVADHSASDRDEIFEATGESPVARAAQPLGNPGNWVTTDDYPSRALREEREGMTTITFDVYADGSVGNCRVTSSSGSPDLDEVSCQAMTRRARYRPAQNDRGEPVVSVGSQRIRWQMPRH
jgi:protein TonB